VVLGIVLVAGGCDASVESPAQQPRATASARTTPPPAADGLVWRQLAGVPSPRTEVAAAVAGSRIYVVGGYAADGSTVATVEALDTATGRWEHGPDLPVAVNHAMAASVSGTVYVFGGYRADQTPSVAAFRLERDGWRPIADLPEGRAAGTAVALAGKVYVAGGLARVRALADRMPVYDAAAERWTTVPGPPTAREHLAGAAAGGRVYTVGGRTAATGNLAAFEVYEPSENRWTTLPDLPTPRGGLAGAATCSGLIVAAGGETVGGGRSATFGEVEAFDPAESTWRALPPLPTPRHGLGVVSVGTTLYALAGGPRPGLTVSAATEALDLAPLGRCASTG
jgi:non-specific serine/threonine protein kinase